MNQVNTKEYQVYIAGPMTGYDDFNGMEFVNMARTLKDKRLHPVHTANTPHNMTYEWYMELSLTVLDNCDAIVLLPNWKDSKGAKMEFDLATKKGIPHFDYADIVVKRVDIVEVLDKLERTQK